jgi:hypothetical protein
MEAAVLLEAQVVVGQMAPLLVVLELLVKDLLEVLVVLMGVMEFHKALAVEVAQVQ